MAAAATVLLGATVFVLPITGAGPTAAAGTSNGASDGTLTLRVVDDVSGQGAYQPVLDTGVANAPITIADPAGHTVATRTGPDGSVTVNLTGLSGGHYRVQANAPAGSPLVPAPAGNGLAPLTSFVDVSGNRNVNLVMGLWDPATYCQHNPDLVTCALDSGADPTGPGLLEFASPLLGQTSPAGPPIRLTTGGQQGAVFGLGTDRAGNVFLGTYVKRHTEYGPAGPVNAIYRYNLDAPKAGVSTFVTLPGALTRHDALPFQRGAPAYSRDNAIYPVVGREGLGDVRVSGDDSTLYAVDLNNSSLYAIPIDGAGANVTAGAPTAYPIPRPANGCVGDWHPFGLGVRGSRVLVGGVCGAETTVTPTAPWGDPSALHGFVDTFTGSGFTPLFDFPLDYPRHCADQATNTTNTTAASTTAGNCDPTPGGTLSADWEAWNNRVPANGVLGYSSAPQPMLSDIEIADNGDLIIALRDRHGDQQGVGTAVYTPPGQPTSTTTSTVVAAGDLLRACVSGRGYALESNGSCGGRTGAGVGNGAGPGGGEFYVNSGQSDADNDHTGEGASAYQPGYDRLWTVRYDPFDGHSADHSAGHSADRQGASELNPAGATTARIDLLGPTGDFGPGNGLAGLETVCDSAPVQVGDRVWFDTNQDGVQGANEPGVPGVTVELLGQDDKVLATRTTDAGGNYDFGTADGLAQYTCYTLKFNYARVKSAALPGSPPTSALRWTTPGVGADHRVNSTVDPATGTAKVCVGGAGYVNDDVDAGLVAAVDSVGDSAWYDANRNGVQDPTDPGVPGVIARLTGPNGAVLATQTTDAAGHYRFTGLLDGAYRVCFDVSKLAAPYTGDALTTPNAAGHNGADSAANPASGCTALTTLGPAKRQDPTLNAGVLQPLNEVGDHVWFDRNHSGLQEPGEPGVPGVTVTLRNGAGQPVATMRTDATGHYLFAGILDGTYRVCFGLAGLPKPYTGDSLTLANAAGHDGADSAADRTTGCTRDTVLGPGHRVDLSLDAGVIAPTLFTADPPPPDPLPFTGVTVVGAGLLAAALLAGGVVLILAARRRRYPE